MKKQYAKQTREIRDWLAEMRKHQGLSMRDLAGRLGVHHSYIGKIESGDRRIEVLDYVRYCSALNLNPAIGIRKLADSYQFSSAQRPSKGKKTKSRPYFSGDIPVTFDADLDAETRSVASYEVLPSPRKQHVSHWKPEHAQRPAKGKPLLLEALDRVDISPENSRRLARHPLLQSKGMKVYGPAGAVFVDVKSYAQSSAKGTEPEKQKPKAWERSPGMAAHDILGSRGQYSF